MLTQCGEVRISPVLPNRRLRSLVGEQESGLFYTKSPHTSEFQWEGKDMLKIV